MESISPFDTLGGGLNEKSTMDEIRRVYYRRVLQCHPDKGGDPDVFQKYKDAYDWAMKNVRNADANVKGSYINMITVSCEIMCTTQEDAVHLITRTFHDCFASLTSTTDRDGSDSSSDSSIFTWTDADSSHLLKDYVLECDHRGEIPDQDGLKRYVESYVMRVIPAQTIKDDKDALDKLFGTLPDFVVDHPACLDGGYGRFMDTRPRAIHKDAQTMVSLVEKQGTEEEPPLIPFERAIQVYTEPESFYGESTKNNVINGGPIESYTCGMMTDYMDAFSKRETFEEEFQKRHPHHHAFGERKLSDLLRERDLFDIQTAGRGDCDSHTPHFILFE
jgi:hypothetical protein